MAFFVSFFALLTTGILVNAHGLRYNTQHGKWIKTGIVVVKSNPKTAEVFLDGKKVDSRTPTRITHVFPGDHTIRVEKEGYHSWEKRLKVEPHQTTFATEIVLFKQESPKTLASISAVAEIFWLQDTLVLAEVDKQQLIVSSVEATPKRLWSTPLTQDVKTVSVQTHPHLPFAAIKLTGDSTRIALFDLHDESKRMLVPAYKTTLNPAIIFDSFSSSLLYTQAGRTFVSFDVDSKTYQKEGSGILLAAQDGQLLMTAVQDGIPTVVISADNVQRTLTSLPFGSTVQTIAKRGDHILLWDNFSTAIYLFDSSKHTLKKMPVTASDRPHVAAYSSNSWILSNEHEVWIIDNDAKADFVDRLSSTVLSSTAVTDVPYLIIQTDQEITVRELDNRDGAARIILPLVDIQTLTLNKKGDVLYTIGGRSVQTLELR